jgi:hypothetical protein
MQPTPFHIRDVSGAIQLSEKREYDDLIGEHPVATLGYVDDDDGEVITVSPPSRFNRALLTGEVGRVFERTV